MNITGRRLREHVRLATPLFLFILMVWLIRVVLGAVSAPSWLLVPFSVTVAISLSVMVAAVMVHFWRFGGYSNLVTITFLLVAWGQILVVLAVLVSILTGIDNIYTAPEFSVRGPDPYHLKHMYGHLTFGIGAGTLIGSAAGCLMLFLLRRLGEPPARPVPRRGP